MDNRSGSGLQHWMLFILLSVIWGSSFILMKEGMRSLDAWQVASLRIFSAGLVLLPVAVRRIAQVARQDLPLVILSGFLGTFFPAYLFCLAETRLDSALAGILNALTPLFTILIGSMFFQIKLPIKKWLGVLVGFSGLVLLMLSGRELSFTNAGYSAFVIVATICYGLNVNLVNRYLRHLPSLELASVAFAMLMLPSGIVLLLTGYPGLRSSQGFIYSTAASTILGIFGTAVASVVFYMLMKKAGPLFASMVTYGIPFVALFWGILAGEAITAIQIFCLGIILGGVYLANRA